MREAEYALDDWTPLRLYDCLRPMLKEQRRFQFVKSAGPLESTPDYLAMQKACKLELEVRN